MHIGIDLGGTKTEIIALDDTNGKELYRQRVPTPPNDYIATIKNMAQMITEAEAKTGRKGTVGIGTPGAISRDTRTIKSSNAVWFNGQPMQDDLSAAIGREVRAENDANCFALSEATDGAGAAYDTIFGVIIGTGCGAGVIANGRIVTGVNSIAGEWGHNPLPFPRIYSDMPMDTGYWTDDQQINRVYADKPLPEYTTDNRDNVEFPGPQCYCNKRGCLETWISGTGLKNDYHRVNGAALSTHDIIAKAKQGDEKCTDALHRYADRLARALGSVINILDPDAIILGGGMGNVNALYDLVPERWDRYIFSDTIKTKLLPPRHGDSSGVRGAAWLWKDA